MSESTTPTIYELARLAGCADPDSATSPGGTYLQSVLDAATEDSWSEVYPSDAGWEIAEAVAPVYTIDIWRTFVDLAGWEQDTDDYAVHHADMTGRARLALEMIAATLTEALLTRKEA